MALVQGVRFRLEGARVQDDLCKDVQGPYLSCSGMLTDPLFTVFSECFDQVMENHPTSNRKIIYSIKRTSSIALPGESMILASLSNPWHLKKPFRSLDTVRARICQVIEAWFEVEPADRPAHAQEG